MTYKEARVYLDELSKYGSVLGLDTIRGLLRELGNPQDDLKFIHIAGTNGKGSVLAYTSTILSEAGYRIGRYVSPTVVSYLERIQVNSVWISEERFAELTEKVKEAIARMEAAGEHSPTVFEAETAIAFLYFKRMNCDLVVLEAGLGGELDATNIIKNTVCAVFASISMDHIGILGNTLEEIAENKAGIIKSGCGVVSSAQKKSVNEILQSRARQTGCEYIAAEPESAEIYEEDYHGIWFSYKEFGTRSDSIHTSMAGRNQIDNAVTALEVIRFLRKQGYKIEDAAVKKGMKNTYWPGRFSCIGEDPVFLLDGAHNEDAAIKLSESLEAYFPDRKKIGIMGVFKDKEYRKIVQIMGPLFSEIYTVDLPDRKRGLPARELAEIILHFCPSVRIPDQTFSQQETVEYAVRHALRDAQSQDIIVVFGSLSYLKQAKDAFDKERGQQDDRS